MRKRAHSLPSHLDTESFKESHIPIMCWKPDTSSLGAYTCNKHVNEYKRMHRCCGVDLCCRKKLCNHTECSLTAT